MNRKGKFSLCFHSVEEKVNGNFFFHPVILLACCTSTFWLYVVENHNTAQQFLVAQATHFGHDFEAYGIKFHVIIVHCK